MSVEKRKLNGSPEANVSQSVTAEERQRLIAEAAYYRALGRGFANGSPEDDWLQAERQIDNALLNSSRRQRPAARQIPKQEAGSRRTGTDSRSGAKH